MINISSLPPGLVYLSLCPSLSTAHHYDPNDLGRIPSTQDGRPGAKSIVARGWGVNTGTLGFNCLQVARGGGGHLIHWSLNSDTPLAMPCGHILMFCFHFDAFENNLEIKHKIPKYLKGDWYLNYDEYFSLALILLVAIILIWEHSPRAIQLIPTWQGLDDFPKSLRPCALDECSLSIGWVYKQCPVVKYWSSAAIIELWRFRE